MTLRGKITLIGCMIAMLLMGVVVVSAQDPVDIDTMPENTLIFSDGTALIYPEGWQIYADNGPISQTASLIYGGGMLGIDATVIITVNQEAAFPAETGRDIVFGLASLYTGREDFVPERDLIREETENGLIIEYVDTSEAERVFGNSYHVVLNERVWVWLAFTNGLEGDGRDREAEVLQMARQITSTTQDGEETLSIRYEDRVLSPITASCTLLADSSLITKETPYALVECPAGCVESGDMATIWGTDIYTADSGVCTAAVHSGAISDVDGGLVLATWMPGQESYPATEQNGVLSSEWGGWDSSFSVEAFDLEAFIAENPDAVVSGGAADEESPCSIIPQNGQWSYAPLEPEVNTCSAAIMSLFDTFNAPMTSQVDFGDPFDPANLILTSSTEPFPGMVTFDSPEACVYTATYEGVEGTFIYTWQLETENTISGSFDFNFAEGLDCQLKIPFTVERIGD